MGMQVTKCVQEALTSIIYFPLRAVLYPALDDLDVIASSKASNRTQLVMPGQLRSRNLVR